MLDYHRYRINPILTTTTEGQGFVVSSGDLETIVREQDLRAYLISIPCNPTGQFVQGEELERYVGVAREKGCTLLLDEFYSPFQKALEEAQASMPRTPVEEETDEVCETCERPMVIKTGRFGRFLACTGFPECRTTRRLLNKTGATCPKCGGDIVERRARGRGRSFYGCSKYPECDFITNRKPLPKPCPECNGLVVQANRSTASCTACEWSEAIEALTEESEEPAAVGD